ncbi:MAG: aldehyde dehydrogenase family protein, partial [Candidatus Binatia bacterium]
AHLHEILLAAGIPGEACVFLPGDGEVGAALVRHAGVRLIAFTGSRAVGMEIVRTTAATPASDGGLKRVVCEMGGKNPLIVDTDADRDEAILAVLESAFGYQGQKCSAASRLIVVGDAEPFLRRLADATLALRIGPPEDPKNAVGPLIEASAVERLREACAEARRDGRTILEYEAPPDGYFVAPAIYADLPPDHRVAREELFGPLLCAFSVDTLEHAIELANRTEYGLTAGVFSRSPAHLALARRELRAGNVDLNRGTTGAFVGRQPFGGVKLSGAGWKAGGPDYLKQFLESRTLTENTLRHGFVPDLPQGGAGA